MAILIILYSTLNYDKIQNNNHSSTYVIRTKQDKIFNYYLKQW